VVECKYRVGAGRGRREPRVQQGVWEGRCALGGSVVRPERGARPLSQPSCMATIEWKSAGKERCQATQHRPK